MASIKVTRRQFLKWLSASAAVLGLSQTDLLRIEKALAAQPTPDPNFPVAPLGRVIWIAGAACSGCPTSLLNYKADTADPDPVLNAIANNALGLWIDIETLYPVQWPPAGTGDGDIDIAEVVLEIVTIDYSQIVMAASGDVPNNYLLSLVNNPAYKYVLLTEGTIQVASQGKYCRIMDLPGYLPAGIWDTAPGGPYVNRYPDPQLGNRTDVTMAGGTLWLASNPNCLAVVALGTCASYGGVPAAKGSVTGGKGTWEWLNGVNGLNKLVANVPGCPPNPDWFIATVGAALLQLNAVPGFSTILTDNLDTSLDHKGRPKNTYTGVYHSDSGYVFCEDCPRRSSKPGPVAGQLQTSLESCRRKGGQTDGKCLEYNGCMGYVAGPAFVRADCPTRWWNNHTNWPVRNNYPCNGCTDPGFPDKNSPFYARGKYPL